MHLLHKFLIIAFACSSSLVWALPSDREQPINIEADHAQMDDASGVTQYKGNAILTQGTLRIEGDTITFFFDDDKNITKAIAQGKLAKYQQIQKEGETPVKARAIQMEYYADRQKIYLIGEGHIIQNGDEFSGNTIQYDIAKGLITANSQPVTVAGETKAKQRLHFTFQPPNKSGSSSNPSKPKASAPAPAAEPEPAPVKETVTSAAAAPKAYPTAMTTSRLNVRSGPGTHYLKLGTLDQGAQVNVLTRQPNWVQVRSIIDGEPVIGWVNGQYLQ